MKRLIILSALLLLCGTVHSGQLIKKITISGLKSVSEDKIISVMESKREAEFLPEKAGRDLKNIFSLGGIADAAIYKNEIEGGIELIVKIQERPLIKNLKYSGADEISVYDLEADTEFKAGSPFELFRLKKSIEKIESMCREKGYNKPQVTYEVSDNKAENTVDITFNVNKGKKYTVSKITINGTRAFTVDSIRGKMETTLPGFLVGGVYKEDIFKKDQEKILDYYRSEGFVNAKIAKSDAAFDEQKEKVSLELAIDEGVQYKFGDIRIEVANPKVYSAEDVAAVFTVLKDVVTEEKDRTEDKKAMVSLLKAKEDKVFNSEILRNDLTRVRLLYSQKGYIGASVEEDRTVDSEKKTISVYVRVKEGKVFFVDKIVIDGNYKTKDYVVEREIRVKAGEPFDGDKLRLSLERIYNLGFFEEVNYNLVPNAADPDRQTLEIKVKERPTGQMNLGATYSSVDGITGYLQVTENNLLGNGQRISATWEFGSVKQNYEFDFLEPYFLNQPVSLGGSVYKMIRSSYVDYSDERIGGNVRFGLSDGDFTKWWLTYQYEQINIFNVAATASPIILGSKGVSATSSLSVNWIEDTRDSIFFNTRKGHRYSATFQYAGGLLLGDNNFTKYILDTSWYYRYFAEFVVALHINASYAAGFGNTASIPFFERFFCGGTDSVRGYEERALSPRDVNNVAIGGAFMIYGNLENRFPIAGPLFGTLFFDFGKSYDSPLSLPATSISTSAGLGIRFIITGAMMIRLDYGYGFDQQYLTPGGKIHFNIGNIF
ncbi:MAG: outer membrane protein assembly factor BamA [Candidatus Firestonebacteria bacterium]